ncbi:MAG: MFS transporter [bacterium]|nr:MFS transporter [bacterium]
MNLLNLPEIKSLSYLTSDAKLLFATRIVRLFAYGIISVVLALYLAQLGFDEGHIGLLLSLTLAGDVIVSLWITTNADRIGRRRMLILGAGLMILAGLVFSIAETFIVLTVVAIIGTISPSGNEVGPFLAIEQAGLTQTIPDTHRTQIFAWYNLVGSLATAFGALVGGGTVQLLQTVGIPSLTSYRIVLLVYALLGGLLVMLFRQISTTVEVKNLPLPTANTTLGLSKSRGIVFRLSALFALDAFGGAFVIQSLVAYWFYVRFGVDIATIGAIFFGANIFAGLSALAAARIASRIGLINTMVFTHIPSNILLMLVPLMPNLPLAVLVLLARFSISQMDVPTRQSYVMAVVDPTERSAAAGVTGIARTIGATLSPVISGAMMRAGFLSLPFFVAGALKITYDLALYRSFRRLKTPEEKKD